MVWWGQRMTQALYAHMNNKKIKIKKKWFGLHREDARVHLDSGFSCPSNGDRENKATVLPAHVSVS
jgi:hypothetical protein